MKRTRHRPEQIIVKLRDADGMLAAGRTIGEVCQALGISEPTFQRWRQQYGGMVRGVVGHLRSDNGPEFIAQALRRWLQWTAAKTLYIAPGAPWENGYAESFHSRLRDE